jgi:hypothetical protein
MDVDLLQVQKRKRAEKSVDTSFLAVYILRLLYFSYRKQ